MKNLKEGALEINSSISNGKTNIIWLGKSQDRDPGHMLNPYFEGIINEITGTEVSIDFTKLEYMNSSTVTSIINLIRLLDKAKVLTNLKYNKNLKWQSASFKALETITESMTNIKVTGL
jgi:hypothetical protein